MKSQKYFKISLTKNKKDLFKVGQIKKGKQFIHMQVFRQMKHTVTGKLSGNDENWKNNRSRTTLFDGIPHVFRGVPVTRYLTPARKHTG